MRDVDKNGDPVTISLFCHSFTSEELFKLFDTSGFKNIHIDSILKISSIFSKEIIKGIDPKFWITLEEIANKENGLKIAGSHLLIEAIKLKE